MSASARLTSGKGLGGARSNPVIFDSSFLIAVSERPTTWFEDMTEAIGRFEPVLLECIERELERLASSQRSKSRLARVALDLVSAFRKVPCGAAAVDDEIASAALNLNAKVATVDSRLARTLKSMGVIVIGLRSGRVSITR